MSAIISGRVIPSSKSTERLRRASADTLKCNVGDPLFSIHKISYDQDGKPIHYSLTTVRCDRVTYVVSTNDSTVMDEKIKSN